MQYKKFGTSYVIRLEIEDELIGSLNEFAIKEKITGGFFYGLGAVKDVSLGYFEVEKKKYKEKTYDMDYELTSLVGDISLFENNVMVHAHVTLADKYFRVLA
ncbi:MAG: DNA-binding protein, partial [candidate division Zixibacteria bacterium]|nr:DNA-binding protein [candidate division Zixibacteria bacterium]